MLLVMAAVAELQAQSKVGSNPTTLDASAAFEIESTSKGFLPPRMTTTQRNAISGPATGLVIFNTTTGTLEINSGTPASVSWATLASPIAAFSSGTTIGLYQTNASTGTGNNSNFFGYRAGNGTTNYYCNYLGANAGYYAAGSHVSNFLGYNAGYNATNAFNDNFLGQNAGYGSSNCTQANFMGMAAGAGSLGAYNSNFIGSESGNYSENANHSNFIGAQAGYDADSASYCNFLGFQAGKSFTGNKVRANNIIIGTNISLPHAVTNAMNIGGVLFGTGLYYSNIGNPSITPVAGGKIGIGVVSPAQTLQVKGDLGLTDGSYYTAFTQGAQTANISYTLPAAAATSSGQVLTNNGSGTLSWTDAGTAAIAAKTSGYTLTSSDNTIVSSNSATITLPAASGLTGKQFHIVSGGGTSTVSGSLVLSGVAQSSYSLGTTDGSRGITVQSDGANWIIIYRF